MAVGRSHDLGNPLSTIQICATALLDPTPPKAEGIRRMAEIIQRSAAWMHQIVHDLLDRAQSRRRASGARATSPPSHVSAGRGRARDQVRDRDPAWLPAVEADPNRLLQVLSNLLGNAMKFTPAPGCVTLDTAEDLSGPDTVGSRLIRFQASDTGPGIPPEDLAHVFDWFWHSGRQGGGTGLGWPLRKASSMPTTADSTSRANRGRAPGSGSPCR